MNTVYKLVWNASRRAWVVAGEFSKSRKKSTRSSLVAAAVASSFALSTGCALAEDNPKQIIDFSHAESPYPINSNVQGGGSAWNENGQIAVAIENSTLSDVVEVKAGVSITGGDSRRCYADCKGSHGNGGDAIVGDNFTLNNSGTIQGGSSGYAPESDGGDGGDGISGNNLMITNFTGASIIGGNGGDSGGYTTIAIGGNGGDGISGNNLMITNFTGASITGGNGDYGDYGGTGGDAIHGSNLSITNSGNITAGLGGDGGIQHGADGHAIHFTGGDNALTLNTGSVITGDVQMDGGSLNTTNNTGNGDETPLIDGGLIIGDNATVTLTGDKLTFSKNATFDANSTLTLTGWDKLGVDGEMNFNSGARVVRTDAAITDWNQPTYTLLTAKGGIYGLHRDNVTVNNPLLNDGAEDYARVYLDEPEKLVYGLAWNDRDGNGHGEFSLKDGATLNLGVALADNTAKAHTSWDGKSLTKSGPGLLVLSAQNTYTGATSVKEGMLKTAVADAFAYTSGVTVSEGATLNLSGNNQTVSALTNSGTVLINDRGAAPLSTPVTVKGDMTLEKTGLVVINNGAANAGQTWRQEGDWTGHGGTVSLGTVLGDDNSKTDRLEITGHASGTTWVAVTNENGAGAHTLEGIEVISTGSSDRDAFVQKGRIVAGSYDYKLQQGTLSGKNPNNWYLTSYTQPGPTPPDEHMWRPEIGSYAANLMAANTMFSNTLNDRHGSVLVDPVTGERHETTMWARAVGGHNEHHLAGGQLNTTANRMVYQMGGEMLTTSFTGDDALHLGVMGAYGHQNSKTHNKYTGHSSRGTVSGYAAGLYGTWFRDEASRTGLYADTWVQYGWFDNTVKGDELADEKYHSKGFMTSLETGYIYPAFSWISGGGMDNTLYLRPQAQVSWSDVKAKDHVEHNGTVVKPAGANHVQTKLGLRVSMTGQSHLDKGSVRKFEPFAEVNWVWNSSQYGVTMNDETSRQQGSRNVAELKTGVEGCITENLGVWGNVSQQLGGHSYSDTQGMVGLKYTF